MANLNDIVSLSKSVTTAVYKLNNARKRNVMLLCDSLCYNPKLPNMDMLKKSDIKYLAEGIIANWQSLVADGRRLKQGKNVSIGGREVRYSELKRDFNAIDADDDQIADSIALAGDVGSHLMMVADRDVKGDDDVLGHSASYVFERDDSVSDLWNSIRSDWCDYLNTLSVGEKPVKKGFAILHQYSYYTVLDALQCYHPRRG
jgi:hypothetical protein